MTSRTRRTIFNSAIVGTTTFLNFGLGAVIIVILPDYLGVEDYGRYRFVFAWGWIFLTFASLGTDQTIIRELARRKEEPGEGIGAMLAFRALLGILAGLLFLIAGLATLPEYRLAVALYSIGIPLNGLSAAFQTILISREKFIRRGIILLGCTSTQLLLTVLLILHGEAGWRAFILAINVIGVGAGTLIGGILAWRLCGPFRLKGEWAFARDILYSARYVGYFYVVVNIANRLDELILKYSGGVIEVGYYGLAKTFFDPMVLFLSAFLTEAFYPVVSELHGTAPERVREAYRQIMRFSLMVVAPISIFLAIFGPGILRMIYGTEFTGSAVPFQILVSFLVIANWHTVQVRFLFASRQERRVILPVSVRLAFGVLLYSILGYTWGGKGMALAFGSALTIEMILYYRRVRKMIGGWSPLGVLASVLLANLLFAGVLFLVRLIWLPYVVGIAALSYPVLLFVTRSLTPQELFELLRIKTKTSLNLSEEDLEPEITSNEGE